MNRIYPIAVLSVALLAARSWAAEPVTVESHITDVTVYPDRAQVTRTAEININPGETRLLFVHLPATLADDSIQAAGKSATQVVIGDVAVNTVVHEQAQDAKAEELEKRVQDLRDEREALYSRQRVIDEQRKLIQSIQVKASADVSHEIQLNKFDVAELKDLPGIRRLGDRPSRGRVAQGGYRPTRTGPQDCRRRSGLQPSTGPPPIASRKLSSSRSRRRTRQNFTCKSRM